MKRLGAMLMLFLLGGCGFSAEGSWNGTWTSSSGTSGTLKLDLRQSGSEVRGTAVLAGSPCVSNASVTGETDGDAVTLSVVSATATLSLAGKGSEDEKTAKLEGELAFKGSSVCAGQSGTWSVTRPLD
jgi:hypothetical protein